MLDKKYIIVLIIAVIFAILIYGISKLFASSCPEGEELVGDECMTKCQDYTEVRDPISKKCHIKCDYKEVFSPNTGECKGCDSGEIWVDNIYGTNGVCQKQCSTNYNCPEDRPNCSNKTCYKNICKSKDGKEEPCNIKCNSTDGSGSLTGICCPPEKIYSKDGVDKCCPGNTIYNNDTKKCVVACGINKCDEGEECVKLVNTNTLINSDKNNNKISIDGDSIFLCTKPEDDKCYGGEQLSNTVPKVVNTYYPCMKLSNGGYCNKKSNDSDVDCFNEYNDSVSCNSSEKCKWVNILDEIANSPNPETKINSISEDISMNTGNQGYYCADDTNDSYSRVIIQKTDNPNCNYSDCIKNFANSSISNIEYNNQTGACIALQDCRTAKQGNLSTSFSLCTDTNNSLICNNIEDIDHTCISNGSILTNRDKGISCNNHGTLNTQTAACECETITLLVEPCSDDYSTTYDTTCTGKSITVPIFKGLQCKEAIPLDQIITDNTYLGPERYFLKYHNQTNWYTLTLCPIGNNLVITFTDTYYIYITKLHQGCYCVEGGSNRWNVGPFQIEVRNTVSGETQQFKILLANGNTWVADDIQVTPLLEGQGTMNIKKIIGMYAHPGKGSVLYIGNAIKS